MTGEALLGKSRYLVLDDLVEVGDAGVSSGARAMMESGLRE
jgi:hypothetical protein